MNRILFPAIAFVLVTLICVASLRRSSQRARLVFDGVCFAAVSAYLAWHHIFPIFPPLSADSEVGDLSLRLIGGTWWLFGARVIVAVLWFTFHRDRRSREARLFSDLFAGAIYVIAGLIVLKSVFSLPVTGVVATSGVVAIVLGLALQNTLADVFAGIAVGIEAPFRIGDRILLNDKIEGQVVQLNWRSVRVQTDGDDIAIIPNSLIAKAEIVNRSFPTERRAGSIELSCPESPSPDAVIETLLHATLLCPDILQIPKPTAAVVKLGSKRNTYRVSFHVTTTRLLGNAKDHLLRACRRQLHYSGLLDRDPNRSLTPLALAGNDPITRRLLRDATLFESLGDEQIDALSNDLRPQRLEPNQDLLVHGQSDKTLYLLASGVIEFLRPTAGEPAVLGRIGAGEYVGEIGLLTGAPHTTTGRACTHCLVYLLPHHAIAPLLGQNAELAVAFDMSARKGLTIINREVMALAAPPIGEPGRLLDHIRNFFRFPSA